MNKTLIFVLGLLTGAAAGSIGTYILVRDKLEQDAMDEIDSYAEHCEERIKRFETRYAEIPINEEEPTKEKVEDEEIKNNEGIKKYHHYAGPMSSDGDRIFKDVKEEKNVTKEEVEKKWSEEDEANHILEATEEDFLNEDDYQKETIDYFFPEERAYWAYGTDNQCPVAAKFAKPLKDLIGNAHKWLVDYTDEDGIGAAYFKNEDLHTIFEVIVHDSTGFNDRG